MRGIMENMNALEIAAMVAYFTVGPALHLIAHIGGKFVYAKVLVPPLYLLSFSAIGFYGAAVVLPAASVHSRDGMLNLGGGAVFMIVAVVMVVLAFCGTRLELDQIAKRKAAHNKSSEPTS